jgi:antitoxin ParD1/3/4
MPSSYALGDKFEKFVESLIKQGRYNSKSEVIRDGLRLLQDRERERAEKIKELREAFRQGIESGGHIPADEVFAELKARYKKMARDRRM